ncbi:hypothetical protein [Acinetobacter sp. YH12239]|uniref:hypothetical protein n=1 Tax=Acinetobacter sp. YH12239 TaxID=2601166 RepID=UPI0015D105A2|nr:hypothetical protein [Acinetobacter sp. YH12239]
MIFLKKICFYFFLLTSVNCLADISDPYPNPHLTDSTLATTFASKLRNEKIIPMEKLIRGECNQFKEYTYLSIQNWREFNNQNKSYDEASTYSHQLVSQFPYQQSIQYTFPLGREAYAAIENHIKIAMSQKRNQFELLKEIDDFCLRVNNTKYYNILSSPKYLLGNKSPFASKEKVVNYFNPEKSMIKSLENTVSKEDKITPKNIGNSINFTKKDLDIACSLIDDDIRRSFITSDITWIDYKNESRKIQNDFIGFMSNGGRNKNFAQIAIAVKKLSMTHPEYTFLYKENLHEDYKANVLNQQQKQYLEKLPQKFGY